MSRSSGKKIEDVNIQLRLTTLKPLHAKWLLEFYNHITSETDAEIILMDGTQLAFMTL